MAEFWTTVVEFSEDIGKAKPKKYKETYLVSADSATYAEAQVHKLLEGELDFTVISASKSKIIEVKMTDINGNSPT
jgi:hypothetical protein